MPGSARLLYLPPRAGNSNSWTLFSAAAGRQSICCPKWFPPPHWAAYMRSHHQLGEGKRKRKKLKGIPISLLFYKLRDKITQTNEQTSEALSPCEWIYLQSRAHTSSPVTAPVHKADHKWALDTLGLRRKGQGEIASVCPNTRGNLSTNKTCSGNGPFPGQSAEQLQSTGRRDANSMPGPKSE